MKRSMLYLMGHVMVIVGFLAPRGAEAIPAFSRTYGMECSACHSAYPALNTLGEGFRLSGYRTYGGAELTPTVPPIKIGNRLELPGTVPISFSLKAGYNFTEINNTLGDGSKNTNTADDFKRSDSSFNLNAVEIDAGASLGEHLSFFLGAPLAETEIRQFFDPEVRQHGTKSSLEGPGIPDLAFVGIHNIFIPDLLNLKVGVVEMPAAFSPEHRRLSFFPYLVYEATALDVIGRNGIEDFISVPGVDEEGLDKNQFRVSKSQLGILLYGRATDAIHKVSDLSLDYFVGVVNGNNVNTDNNKTKDLVGRLAATYAIGSSVVTLGGFGYYSGNTLDSNTTNPDTGASYKSRLWRAGPDITITLAKPFYISLYSQILFAQDSNPTGFAKKATWWGGFVGADVKPIDPLVLYARFDWINGRQFNDTDVTVNGVSGVIGPVRPSLWDVVAGAQYFLYENFKLIAEYRRGEKNLRPDVADVSQLKTTTENAVFAGFQLSF
jgi:hypothetical protein